jgi:hypothetical protein
MFYLPRPVPLGTRNPANPEDLPPQFDRTNHRASRVSFAYPEEPASVAPPHHQPMSELHTQDPNLGFATLDDWFGQTVCSSDMGWWCGGATEAGSSGYAKETFGVATGNGKDHEEGSG